tara:strand:- start:127 stop:438 length:312 start_codon:yes stop_codon:yes gene_type:complete
MADEEVFTKATTDLETGETVIIPLSDEEIAELLNNREIADADLSSIRARRNSLLFESDWTQMADSPVTDEKKAEWATYRQELRDFPSTASKVSEFGDFPTQPE